MVGILIFLIHNNVQLRYEINSLKEANNICSKKVEYLNSKISNAVKFNRNTFRSKYLVDKLPKSSVEFSHLPLQLERLCANCTIHLSTLDDYTSRPSVMNRSEYLRLAKTSSDTLHGDLLVDTNEHSRLYEHDYRLLSIDNIVHGYQVLFEATAAFSYTNFLGIPLQQDPNDAFAIMDLIWRLKPDLLIELGTAGGGSAYYYGMIMHAYNEDAKVVTIDPMRDFNWNQNEVDMLCPHCINARETNFWKHSNVIHFYQKYPKDMLSIIDDNIKVWGSKCVMVIEDSNHLTETVLENLNAYAKYVTPGSYMIVQDMKMSRLLSESKISPQAAVDTFLHTKMGRTFSVDRTYEYYHYTQHAKGFLRKTKDPNVDVVVIDDVSSNVIDSKIGAVHVDSHGTVGSRSSPDSSSSSSSSSTAIHSTTSASASDSITPFNSGANEYRRPSHRQHSRDNSNSRIRSRRDGDLNRYDPRNPRSRLYRQSFHS